jgi:NifU-like protein involved in Fe-S cluster formation
MARTQYSPLVMEHFERPRNVGRLAKGPGVIAARTGSVAQGTAFLLTVRVDDEAVQSMGFEAYGCPHCIAAASWLTQRLVGALRSDLAAWSWREASSVLEVPAEKRGRLLLLEDAVRQLADHWQP